MEVERQELRREREELQQGRAALAASMARGPRARAAPTASRMQATVAVPPAASHGAARERTSHIKLSSIPLGEPGCLRNTVLGVESTCYGIFPFTCIHDDLVR